MGQRHQAYLRLPEVYYNSDNVNNRPQRNVGLHHQWLYGYGAVNALYRFLAWVKKDSDNLRYISHDENGAFEAAYSFDHELGYYHRVHTLTKEDSKDPNLGDNNNGITVIDLAGKIPGYCFASIGHLECLAGEFQPIEYAPIGVDTWLRLHYPNWQEENPEILKRVRFIEDKAELITIGRLKEIFPAMYSEVLHRKA